MLLHRLLPLLLHLLLPLVLLLHLARSAPTNHAGLFGLEPNGQPLVSLRGYVLFWGWAFTAVTLAIALLKQESPEYDESAANAQQRRRKQQAKAASGGSAMGGAAGDWGARVAEIRRAYHKLWGVVRGVAWAAAVCVHALLACRTQRGETRACATHTFSHSRSCAHDNALPQVCLRPIWGLSFLLLSYRLGVLPAESASALKLLDKGVAKEALAALVLVQFPVELASAVIAGRRVARRRRRARVSVARAQLLLRCAARHAGQPCMHAAGPCCCVRCAVCRAPFAKPAASACMRAGGPAATAPTIPSWPATLCA